MVSQVQDSQRFSAYSHREVTLLKIANQIVTALRTRFFSILGAVDSPGLQWCDLLRGGFQSINQESGLAQDVPSARCTERSPLRC